MNTIDKTFILTMVDYGETLAEVSLKLNRMLLSEEDVFILLCKSIGESYTYRDVGYQQE